MFRLFLGCMGVTALSLTAVVVLGIWFVNNATDDFGPDFSIEDASEEILARVLVQLDSTAVDEAVASSDENLPVGGAGAGSGAPPEVADTAEVADPPEVAAPPEVVDSPAMADPPAMADLPEMELAEALDLAADTIGELEEGLARANSDLEDARDELEEALEQQGVGEWVTSRLDSVGFGFGWWTLYFTILMPWMKGQTPGKRALGVRVVRLDGHPVTWWHAFERAGGYAAGLATGTLGFVQIYWDANRQAIHDKVAGTVVIRDGVAKVPGNWDRQVTGRITPGAGDPA